MRWTVVLAILLLTGCSTPVDGGAVGVAVSSTTDAEPVPWDPCTIPDSAVEAAGLNVGSKESGILGRDQNGFKICGWEDRPPGNSYFIRLFVGLEDIGWIFDPVTFDRVEAVRVGSRDSVQFQQVGADATLDCGVAFTAGSELVMAILLTDPLVRTPPYHPCTELNDLVARLDSELPS